VLHFFSDQDQFKHSLFPRQVKPAVAAQSRLGMFLSSALFRAGQPRHLTDQEKAAIAIRSFVSAKGLGWS
jgi:hypothetical protein